MVQPVRVIRITGDRLVSGEFRDEGRLALLTQWRDAPIKVEEQLLKRQTWQANVNSGLLRPTPVPAYRLSVGMCMSGCAPTGARTSYTVWYGGLTSAWLNTSIQLCMSGCAPTGALTS